MLFITNYPPEFVSVVKENPIRSSCIEHVEIIKLWVTPDVDVVNAIPISRLDFENSRIFPSV